MDENDAAVNSLYQISAAAPAAASPGVYLIRSLLNTTTNNDAVMNLDAIIPSRRSSSSLKLHLKSVEFLSETNNDTDDKSGATAGISAENDADDEEEEDGDVRYTYDQPYETTIVNARYLTVTSIEAADEICEEVATTTTVAAAAQDILDRRFPL